MPRKAKDTTNVDKKDIEKPEVISKKSSSKISVTKKVTTKNITSKTSKSTAKSSVKNVKSDSKTSSTNKVTSKNSSAKKTSTKKEPTKKATTKRQKKAEIIEYYDLPYRYNQTIVKIIAQTPTTLFVYWDVSDEDKKSYIAQYGEYFYNNTKPVLIVHNITKNYSTEIDINDYANSWYLKVNDSKCDYKIELGRRSINQYISIPNNYLYISSSNELEIPNDHILFENMKEKVFFRNVKTYQTTQKDISSISFLKNIGNLYNIKEFYKLLYTNNNFTFEEFNLKNPSSGNPSSTFK